MSRWRFLQIFGFFRVRKQRPVSASDHLLDGDGAYLTDENGNKLTG